MFKDQAMIPDPTSKPVIEPSPALLHSIATHVSDNLPKYAVPIFIRVMREMQATGNNKQQKHVLRSEGVNPDSVQSGSSGGLLYWLRDGTYVPFTREDWEKMNAGAVRL
jgi:hypothetical protein